MDFQITRDTDKRIRFIESKIRQYALEGRKFRPAEYRMPEIFRLRRQLYDLTDGKNTVIFDKLGRPSIVYILTCDENSRADHYTQFLGAETTEFTPDWNNTLPCFIRNNSVSRYIYVQKYRPIRYKGVNYSISLPDMAQAYGTEGFTVSYNGVNRECDRVNQGTFASGLDIHEITWDEYAMLSLESTRLSVVPHGNDTFGASFWDSRETGKPSGATVNGVMVHTLNGSGTRQWRHNGLISGVSDLVSSTRVILSGIRLKGGEIQLIDFRGTSGDLSAEELNANWKCIREGGALVAPNDPLSYKVDYVLGEHEDRITDHCISTRIHNRAQEGDLSATRGNMVTLTDGTKPCPLLRFINFLPYNNAEVFGCQYFNNTENSEFILLAGADFESSYASGLSYRLGCDSLDYSDEKTGALMVSHSDKLEY